MLVTLCLENVKQGGKTFYSQMKFEFKMSLVGELAYFLGFQLKKINDGIFISQSKYALIFSLSLIPIR